MTPITLLTIAVIGLTTIAIFSLVFSYRRKKQLQSMPVHVNRPAVPFILLDKVREAENIYYRDLPWHSKIVKNIQDSAALQFPVLAYTFNSSIGQYRIKPNTLLDSVDYAVKNEFLILRYTLKDNQKYLLPYHSIQPLMSEVQASVLLQMIKDKHPILSGYSWEKICSDEYLMAKIYSGYTGAGGDWDTWMRDENPGPVAMYRFGIDEKKTRY